MKVNDWVDVIVSEFNLFILEKYIPQDFKRLDEFWFTVEDITENGIQKYKNL